MALRRPRCTREFNTKSNHRVIIIIIIIISIFIEDNVFSTTASLPYGPQVNTDIDYFRTFFVIIRTFSYYTCDVSDAVFCFGRREASACLIMLSAMQGS